jgi:hypothetical protein
MPFAGVAWQVLHYLEGFRRLGHRVFYLEDTGAWPFDPERGVVSEDAGPALAYVRRMLERVQLDDAWAYRDAVDGKLHGASEERLRAELERADALVNVSAVTVLGEEHMRVPVRIYLETDPVLAQIEIAQGNQRTVGLLAAHTHHFTYGENFGAPDCTVPLERFAYHPTRQPVILDWWTPKPGDGPRAPLVHHRRELEADRQGHRVAGRAAHLEQGRPVPARPRPAEPGEPPPRARPGHRRRRGRRPALSGGMERSAGRPAVRRPRSLPRLRARLGG